MVASALAAVVAGLEARRTPPAPADGNLYGAGAPLPESLNVAIALASLDDTVAEILSAASVRDFVAIASSEWAAWSATGNARGISPRPDTASADVRFTVEVADWSGRDYAEVIGLQRTMIAKAMSALEFSAADWVLDIGCGDGYLTAALAELVPAGAAVGADASPRMIHAAATSRAVGGSGPWFVIADARALPFTACFDAAVSFNALHWVPQQLEALRQVASVLKPGGRATIQMVCGGARTSIEATAMALCRSPAWSGWFDDFVAPFVHVDPSAFRGMVSDAGLLVEDMTVTDEEWDFGSRDAFQRWCAVGSTAWTDRLPEADRLRFVADEVAAYEPVAGRAGLFRFTQMRAVLRR